MLLSEQNFCTALLYFLDFTSLDYRYQQAEDIRGSDMADSVGMSSASWKLVKLILSRLICGHGIAT
jgi:hypothetical protein